MRQIGFVFAALFSLGLACGPDPNATLPGVPRIFTGGGGSSGGEDAAADAPADLPAGGGAGASTGGAGGAGGTDAKAAAGTGGASGLDAARDSLDSARDRGDVAGRTDGRGGTAGRGTGGRSGTGGSSYLKEPCSPAKDLSCARGSGNTGQFGPPTTTDFCFRTMDTLDHWGCGSPTGWTLKVNGQTVACNSGKLPAPINGFLYFQMIGDARSSQTNIWWDGVCKAPPYPPWPPPPGLDAGGIDGGEAQKDAP